jgi:CMP-N-acetylneuraminic acid synthetase
LPDSLVSVVEKTYTPNGAIYISSHDNILKSKSFYKGKLVLYPMPEKKSVDINTLKDFKKAYDIYKRK